MPLRPRKSLSQIQDEIEYKDAELTLEQKQYVLKKLKANSLELKEFSGWRSAWQWVKSH